MVEEAGKGSLVMAHAMATEPSAPCLRVRAIRSSPRERSQPHHIAHWHILGDEDMARFRRLNVVPSFHRCSTTEALTSLAEKAVGAGEHEYFANIRRRW